MAVHTDFTVDISAAPEVVWAVISDVESWPEWTASVTSVRRLSSARLQVGSRVRLQQPRLPATVWTVADLVAGEQFTWTADSPGVRTRAFHRVVGRADGPTGRRRRSGLIRGCPRVGGGAALRGPRPALPAEGGCRPQAALRGVRSAPAGLSRPKSLTRLPEPRTSVTGSWAGRCRTRVGRSAPPVTTRDLKSGGWRVSRS
ncbi:SRPBCC family protein [Blastococcus mobilis]|uniref:SRPBCC family protein n=1 Tax=Blastococcus mobilis TaxID=1938746 RepID=UPI0034A0C518